MIDWCVAEFAERLEPGVWLGSSDPAIILVSTDNERWMHLLSLEQIATIGRVSQTGWPNVETVSGELRSIPEPGDMNLMVLGGEVLSFGDAHLVGPESYTLDRFVRGMRGTDEHEPERGEQFMMIDTGAMFLPLPETMIGQPLWWKAVPNGGEPERFRSRPGKLGGARVPRLDGSRPNVRGFAGSRPNDAQWGDRFIVGTAVWTWLDRWIEEPIEAGATVYVVEDGSRRMWDGSRWARLPLGGDGAF